MALGLKDVPTDELEKLLRAVHRKGLSLPLLPAELACVGLQHRVEDLMAVLRGLDERGVRAVLVAVIAERR